MSDNRTKEQLLMELIESQGILEEKLDAQDRLIQRFRLLADNEGLFNQIIHYFPYPIVLFAEDGRLKLANEAFFNETKRTPEDVAEGSIDMLTRLTTENYEILEAVHNVFSGETIALKGLRDPLSMFVSDMEGITPTAYESAIFFPLMEEDGQIRVGACMFAK